MNGFGKTRKRSSALSHGRTCFVGMTKLNSPFFLLTSEGEETVQDFLRKFEEKIKTKSVDDSPTETTVDESKRTSVDESRKSTEKSMTSDVSSDDIDSVDDSIESIDSQM